MGQFAIVWAPHSWVVEALEIGGVVEVGGQDGVNRHRAGVAHSQSEHDLIAHANHRVHRRLADLDLWRAGHDGHIIAPMGFHNMSYGVLGLYVSAVERQRTHIAGCSNDPEAESEGNLVPRIQVAEVGGYVVPG